jgi:hypothetical protein
MTTEPITLTLAIPDDTAPDIRDEAKREIETVASAILVAMQITGLAPEFTRRRERLVANALAVAQVQSTKDEAAANAAYKELGALKKEIEAQEAVWKGPLNATKAKIIDLVEEGLEPVTKARKRLKDMIDGHAAELLAEQRRQEAERQAAIARAAAEQRAAEEAAARLAREQEAATRAAEQAQRDAEEAAKRAAEANSPAAKAAAAKAQQDAEDAQRKAQEDEARLAQEAQDAADAADAAAMLPTAPPVAEITHARGVSAKMVRDFALLGDPDPFRAARSAEQFAAFILTQRPDLARLLKIEIRRADMLEFLKDEAAAKAIAEAKPPGIRFFERVQSTNR